MSSQGSKGNDREGENCCSDLQPRTTRVPASIRFNRNNRRHRLFKLSDEPIPPPRQRLDKARTFGRIPQHFPNLVNRSIQVVIDVDKSVGPEPLLQLLPRHYLAGLLQQNTENLKRLPPEPLLQSSLAQFAGTKVNFEISEPDKSKPGLCLCHH
jgi:hypothetical protein